MSRGRSGALARFHRTGCWYRRVLCRASLKVPTRHPNSADSYRVGTRKSRALGMVMYQHGVVSWRIYIVLLGCVLRCWYLMSGFLVRQPCHEKQRAGLQNRQASSSLPGREFLYGGNGLKFCQTFLLEKCHAPMNHRFIVAQKGSAILLIVDLLKCRICQI